MWPAADQICYDCILQDVPFLEAAAKRCPRHRRAIQAGGNAGMYPLALANHFGRVVTFEPEETNHYCLVENTKDRDNIEVHNAALGNSHQAVKLWGWAPNSGSWEVAGAGTIPQMKLDDFGYDDVDFVQLDIQGCEWQALMGGEQTIKRCRPVLMVEETLGNKSGLRQLLADWGYVEQAATGPADKSGVRDAVYTCES